MYATRPSVDATISCGSVPAGTRATTFMLAGSTIAIALSLFSRTSNAGDGVCADADEPTIIANAQTAHALPTNFRHRPVAVISHSPSGTSILHSYSPQIPNREKPSAPARRRPRLF